VTSIIAAHPDDSALARDVDAFAADGYLVLRGLIDPSTCDAIVREVEASLHPVLGPAEFEADVGYPGAPRSRNQAGGDTPRRLLHAYSRFASLRPLVTGPRIARHLRALMGSDRILLSQCHHNCVMTKSPGFSSLTLWHQDVRYWAFERPELVSLWLALGQESADNGALQVIPGTHREILSADRYDEALFLRPDLPENQALIARARTIELDKGDALFFHCRTFHAAGRNLTERVKLSGVFTYHTAGNRPVVDSPSARFASIELPRDG
jgi:phytanoyl-CoA hydroxylase